MMDVFRLCRQAKVAFVVGNIMTMLEARGSAAVWGRENFPLISKVTRHVQAKGLEEKGRVV